MKLELTPEVHAGLLAKAQQNGMTLEAFAERVLRERIQETATTAKMHDRPIWEVITGLMKGVPEEVFDRLPKDGASQVDHYIYGLPKRD